MTTQPARDLGTDGAGPRPTAAGRSAIPRGLAILLGSAATVIILAGVMAAAALVGPIFLALVLVIALSPIQRWLQDHRWPGWASTLALVIAVYGVLLSFAVVIVVSIAQLATELPKYAENAQGIVDSITDALKGLGVGPEQAQAVASAVDPGKLAGFAASLLSSLAETATSFVFLLALLLFLTLESSGVGARLATIATEREEVVTALGTFATGTRKYLLVTTVFGLIVAVLDGIALALLGVPLAVLWGVLAFITNYIPNIGFIIGLVPPALLALLVGGWSLMLWVVVIYCTLNFVIQSLIQPRFVGDSVGLSPTVTFVSLVFWAWILGPLGALLAVPLTLLGKAFLVDIDPRARWANAWLRLQPPDRPAKQKQQRAVPRRAVAKSSTRRSG